MTLPLLSQRKFAVLIKGRLIVGAPVKHAAAIVNRGIDQRVSFAAIFGLHMQCDSTDCEIRIVPEDHDSCSLPVTP